VTIALPAPRSAAAGSRIGPLRPVPAASHPLHGPERDWTEVNCYVDVWVEVLAWLGHDPVPALACTLSADVDVDQWVFLKPGPEDLRRLYGIEVRELNVWRPVLDHVCEQLDASRLITVEVDSWYLPDTRGRAYQLQHDKTTIAPAWVDPAGRRLGYFHGPGYYELDAADFDGLFARPPLPPYTETVRLPDSDQAADHAALAARAVELAAEHLRRAPQENPVVRLERQLLRRVDWLPSQEPDAFHALAFATARQCGGTAELAADLAGWLAQHAGADTAGAVGEFRTVSESAKALQFNLARVARGRRGDIGGPFARMADSWHAAMMTMQAALLP
jgi:hypothetical protein